MIFIYSYTEFFSFFKFFLILLSCLVSIKIGKGPTFAKMLNEPLEGPATTTVFALSEVESGSESLLIAFAFKTKKSYGQTP